jgi:hypothetical protein
MLRSHGRLVLLAPGSGRRLRIARIAAVVTLAATLHAGTARASTYQVPSSIASDCSVDVTQPLLSWIASTPNNSILSFGANRCYRVEGTLEIRNRSGLDLQGNGSTFKSFDAPSDQRAMWRVVDSSGFRFQNMRIEGSYAGGGTFAPALQHAHGIDLRGTSAEIADVSSSNLAGDCVYFGLGYTSALTRSSGSVHDSSCSRTGRNAVSVTAAVDVRVERMTTSAIGFIAFDVEPNSVSGFGTQRVTFDSNVIGSYYLYAYSIVENALNSDQTFSNNRVLGGKGLRIGVVAPGGSVRPQNVTITGNSADTATWSPAIEVYNVDRLTVTNNNVPLTGGTMATVRESCDVTIAGNTFPGGLSQAATSSSSCSSTPTVTQPPSVSIAAPADGATLLGKNTTVSANTTGSVTKLELYIDAALKATSTTSSISTNWNLQRVSRGAHTITARVYGANNEMASRSITVYR